MLGAVTSGYVTRDATEIAELSPRYTLANPALAKLEHLGKDTRWVPRVLTYYRVLASGERVFPRDGRPSSLAEPARGEPLAYPVELREYQRGVAAKLLAAQTGYVVIPCGGGKTITALAAIAEINTRTLVLVHTRELKRQWEDQIARLLPGAEINVRTIQSNPSLAGYGMLVLDEAHHVAATTFHDVVGKCDAKYKLALTATPKRADGLDRVLPWFFGSCLLEVSHEQLVAAGALVRPLHLTIHSGCNPAGADYSEISAAVCADRERNRKILDSVLRTPGFSIVLTGRVEHAEYLHQQLAAHHERVRLVHGKMPKAERAKAIEDMRTGEARILVATTLADEGLDIPALENVFLVFPTRAVSRTIQRVGRIMRPHPGKRESAVFDVRDPHPMLISQYNARRAACRTILGMDC